MPLRGAHRRPLLEFGAALVVVGRIPVARRPSLDVRFGRCSVAQRGVLSDSQLSVVAPGRTAGTEASSFSDSSRLGWYRFFNTLLICFMIFEVL